MDDQKYDQIREVILMNVRTKGHTGGGDHGNYIPKSQLLGILAQSAYTSDLMDLDDDDYPTREDFGNVLDTMKAKRELVEFSKNGDPHIAFAPEMAEKGEEVRDEYYEEEYGITSIEHRG